MHNIAEKLAADESEVVVLALKILIEHRHLGKAQGQELHDIHAAQFAQHAFAQAGRGRRDEGAVVGTLAHIQSAKEVHVAHRDSGAQIFIFLQILKIGFHQRMKLLHLRHEEMLALNGSIDNLVEAGGGGTRLLSGGVTSL